MNLTMERFFVRCGRLIVSHTEKIGTFPKTTFIQHWDYVNGHASFDGRVWTFWLRDEDA